MLAQNIVSFADYKMTYSEAARETGIEPKASCMVHRELYH